MLKVSTPDDISAESLSLESAIYINAGWKNAYTTVGNHSSGPYIVLNLFK